MNIINEKEISKRISTSTTNKLRTKNHIIIMDNKEQTGLWIPLEVLHLDLVIIDRLILSDILSINNSSGSYYKLNKKIATLCRVSESTVKRSIARLKSEGFIQVSLTRPYEDKNIVKRDIIACISKIKELNGIDCKTC